MTLTPITPELPPSDTRPFSPGNDPPTHGERIQARQRANTPWPKLDRSWVDHPFYTQSDETMREPDAS